MENKKILIVEDEADTREAISRFLTRKGYTVFQAPDGQEAWEIFLENLPDLIITDIIMPNMDGNRFIKKIRDTATGKKIPIIVVTIRKNMVDYFETIGVDDFIAKPCTPEDILASVRKILNQDEGPPGLHPMKRILIGGRDQGCVETMAGQVSAQGFHTDFIISGEQLVSKAVLFLPNVMILENRMHGIPAHEIVHILRQMPQFKKIPILIYSHSGGNGNPSSGGKEGHVENVVSIDHCLENGATEYIGPYDEKTFPDRIGKYVSQGAVVLIDDDKGFTQLIKAKVETAGYRVFAARGGEEGLRLIRKIKPGVVLLDVLMPDLDGFAVLEIIKKDPVCHDTRVIMITVKGNDTDIQRGLALGADDYLVKPFYAGLLIKKIKSFMP